MKRDSYIDEALGLASEYISGKSVPQDYEQAVYWLTLIASESEDAQALLGSLMESGLGIEHEADFPPDTDNRPFNDQTKIEYPRKELKPSISRCINCGATDTLTDWNGRALICNPNHSGCGSVQDLVITEYGLTKGLAIQPYTLKHGVKSFLGSQIKTLKYDSSIGSQESLEILTEISTRIKECSIIDRIVPNNIQCNLTVVPVPSSKRRRIQPVYELAKMIAGEKFSYAQALSKHSEIESKTRSAESELLKGEITCRAGFAADNVLLLDDTYGKGATVRACVSALKNNGIVNVFFLTLCKNTFDGMKS